MDRTGSNPQFRNAGVFWLASTTALFGSSAITENFRRCLGLKLRRWGFAIRRGYVASGQLNSSKR
jgi:hypothetical protein